MVYGYIRVSSKEQNVDRQMDALLELGINKRNVFTDKQSGKDFERPAYKRLMKKLKQGDLLIIKSIDRLGRNYDEILEQWRIITKQKQADVFVIDFPLLDTRKKENDLTGTFVADLVLQILSYVAQTEREFIHRRQAEGIASAKKRGVKFGRESQPLPDNFEQAKRNFQSGKMSVRQAAEMCGMSSSTFYRKIKNL
ncbi:MAG: recombinase family protein [Clostridia bacterium]|nr:recombinase family protein [Clostridia bacterium]